MVLCDKGGLIKMKKQKYLATLIILVIFFSLAVMSLDVYAGPLMATAPTLGVLKSFTVVGASAVTSTGFTILNGDLGINPNNASSVTGFTFSGPPGPGLVTGETHFADGVALNAQNKATTVYVNLGNQPCKHDLTGQDLGGLTLAPGVYCFDSSAQLTGALVLDAEGDPNAVWIFQIGSALTTASNSSVSAINSKNFQPCNVFFHVGSSATLGTTTQFIGNIFADQSITMNTNANLLGRVVALNAAVTLDDNTITPVTCAPVNTGPGGGGGGNGTGGVTAPGLPSTGSGAPILNEVFPLNWVIFGGICAIALLLGVRTYRRSDKTNK
jgi:hypothetical protein